MSFFGWARLDTTALVDAEQRSQAGYVALQFAALMSSLRPLSSQAPALRSAVHSAGSFAHSFLYSLSSTLQIQAGSFCRTQSHRRTHTRLRASAHNKRTDARAPLAGSPPVVVVAESSGAGVGVDSMP